LIPTLRSPWAAARVIPRAGIERNETDDLAVCRIVYRDGGRVGLGLVAVIAHLDPTARRAP